MPFRLFATSLAMFALSFLASSEVLAQTEIPGVGSWKLIVAKSKLGSEPPRSMTSKIEVTGEHATVSGVLICADGTRSEARYSARLDGKDYPIVGSSYADTISLKKIDARTIERIDKKAGRVVESSVTVFSEDGKTSTTTGKATNARGQDFEYKFVNEKLP